MRQSAPGYQGQAATRTAFRIGGAVAFGAGLVLVVIAFADFLSQFGSESMEPPKKFFLVFIGLPLMGVGGWLLKAGFGGAVAKYAAGELAPTARDTLDYVGLGKGSVTCAGCGARNDVAAKFCDDCGSPLARTCASCGRANAGDARFCADCGTAIA